jgi:hypothetical protein
MSDSQPARTLSQEDIAFYAKNIWSALLEPDWKYDDLVELGKAVYAKIPLNKMDDKKFNRLFPLLVKISQFLGEQIQAKLVADYMKEFEKSEAVQTPSTASSAPSVAPTPVAESKNEEPNG